MNLYAWLHAKHNVKSVNFENDHIPYYETVIIGPTESFQEIFDHVDGWNNNDDDNRHWKIVATWDVDAVEKSAPWTLYGVTQGIVDGVEASFLNKRVAKACIKASHECGCPSCSAKPYRQNKNS